jgi:peptidoglycan/xylan/chitin deacetylase (PgdA/CDA1 family)
VPILAYHAIVGMNGSDLPPGWSARHAVRFDSFRSQLAFMKDEGWATTLPEKIESIKLESPRKLCILTFDDGHSSDLIAAATMKLHEYRGIFYVPWEHIGRNGFLNTADLIALSAEKFVIASHGLTHSPLTQKSEQGLREELVESKQRLEDLIGRSIEDLAVPFGRYNRQVITAAKAAGYRRIMTSDIGIARTGSSVVFPRLPVNAETTLVDFRRLISLGPARAVLRRLSTATRHRMETLRNAAWRTQQLG